MDCAFGSLALLSLALLLWQWLAARRFPLHRRSAEHPLGTKKDLSGPDTPNRSSALQPPVTLLKPLKGRDVATEACLRSWLAQDYTGEIQVLFGVASADDPVSEVVRTLLRKYHQVDAQLIVCGPPIGANAKVSKLAELEKLAKHDILVISDADVRVPPDLLANAVVPMSANQNVGQASRLPRERGSASEVIPSASPTGAGGTPALRSQRADNPSEVGLVSCFYRLANPATLAMQWEAIAINADFWSQVLQSQTLKPLDFALGAVMVTRRKPLDEVGGFKALADCLADDYQLGNRIVRNGYRIELCPVVVECWDPPTGWRGVWKHQLRWARTIRVCQPLPYFFSILSNSGFWAILWLALGLTEMIRGVQFSSISHGVGMSLPLRWEVFAATACVMIRVAAAYDLQRRLTRSSSHAGYYWLVPIKDLLQAAIWLCAFAGNRIEWRGQWFHLRRDGTLVKD